jgi:hypothetical protein
MNKKVKAEIGNYFPISIESEIETREVKVKEKKKKFP